MTAEETVTHRFAFPRPRSAPRLFSRALLLGMIALGGCNLDVARPADNPTDPATETFAPALNVNLSLMRKTENGVYVQDAGIGTGAVATMTSIVIMSYVGYVKSGAVIEVRSGATVNLSGAVYGLREGLAGMRVGGDRRIIIPSKLGYGASSVGSVPPNSTLIFDVHLDQIP